MTRESAKGTRIPATASTRRRIGRALIAVAATVAAGGAMLPTCVRAQEAQSPLLASTFGLSGALGFVFPGTVTVEGTDVDTKSGFLLQAAADYYLVPRFAVGVYLQYQSVGIQDTTGKATIVGLGPTLKARFPVGDRFLLRPSLSIGYQHGSWTGSTETTNGLGVGLMVEGVIPLGQAVNGLIQVGFTTQPSGGNKNVNLTWAPIFYLAAGVEYSQ